MTFRPIEQSLLNHCLSLFLQWNWKWSPLKNSRGSEPICVCIPHPEPYLLSRSKPQEPSKEHAIIFLTIVAGDISNSQNLVCGQNLGWYHCFHPLISASSPHEHMACRTTLTLSPRIMLWLRTAFHIGEKGTSFLEQKKPIIFSSSFFCCCCWVCFWFFFFSWKIYWVF